MTGASAVHTSHKGGCERADALKYIDVRVACPHILICKSCFLEKNGLNNSLNVRRCENMDFGSQIKSIRQKEKLTQEQFALKLNISRQADF